MVALGVATSGCNGSAATAEDRRLAVDAATDAGLPRPEADAAPAPRPPRWRALFDDLDGPVLSVWGSSLRRTFFVGEGGLILQRRGDTWWRWDAPTERSLWWVWGRSERDVYAGGEGGTLLHFDGTRWRTVDAGLGDSETVWGIWGSADAIWAVGGRAMTNGPGFVLRGEGEQWSRFPAADLPNLYKVWGNDEGETFVVGDDSSLYRASDDVLVEVDLGAAGENPEPLFTIAGNDRGTVIAVGGVSQALAFELGSNGFEPLPFATAGLNGVSVGASGEVTVVGLSGVIRERTSGDWHEHDFLTDRHYHATARFGDGAYAVGGDLLSSGAARRGLIVMRGDVDTATPDLVWRENPAQVDGGVPDSGPRDAGDGVLASLDSGPSFIRDAGFDGGGVEPEVEWDAASDAASDAAPSVFVDSGEALPGPSELCGDEYLCAPGLECWYIQGEGELRCVEMCDSAEECDPAFGSDAVCAPPGCQTTLGTCLRSDWVGCYP
jgi:hypothetical protein